MGTRVLAWAYSNKLHGIDYSPPLSTDVKNDQSFIPFICLHGVTSDSDFTFFT